LDPDDIDGTKKMKELSEKNILTKQFLTIRPDGNVWTHKNKNTNYILVEMTHNFESIEKSD
jgi:hypothetical protein